MYMGTATPRPRDIDIYIPITQDPSRIVSMAVRTATDPAGFIAPIRAEIARLSPRSPLDWIDTMPNDLRRGFEGPRFYTVLLLAFAGSALVLTAAGLFAVLARAVAAQRVEMGVRRAFGARRRDLLTSVVRSGLSVCGAGVAVGAAVALVVAVFLGRTLYGIGAFDPRAVLVASVVILATGMSASLLPAYRATSADPTEAIRDS